MKTHYTFSTGLIVSCLTILSACSPTDENTTTNIDATSPVNKPEITTEVTKTTSKTSETVDTDTNDNFPYAFESVTKNTWVIHGPLELPNPENKGFMNNPAVVKTSAGLVVIDPGSTVHVGRHVLNAIKEISDQPIVAVFNTHIHGDHWLANLAMKAAYPNVKIYGHQEMLNQVASGEGDNWVTLMHQMTDGASEGTMVVAPDHAVNADDIITIGDTRFKIHHYGTAHTNTDIMIEAIENSVVFLGDNVLTQRIPRMSDGTFQGTIDSVNKVLESNAKIYVPGHGPTGNKAMVEDYINYLTLIYKAAQKAFEEDLDSSDVLALTKQSTAAYKDWAGYDEQLGPHGAQAFSEVEAAEF